LNEPGASKKHPDFLVYNKIIEYKNVDIAILKMIQKVSPFYNPLFDGFDDILKEIFIKNAEVIKDDLEKKKKRVTEYLQTNYYKMVVKLDYAKLYKDFMDVYNMIHGIEKKTIEEENIVVEKKKTTKKKVWKL
jgi:hypothetical protein